MGPFNIVWLIWALMSYLCACACPQQSTRWLFVAAACTTPILIAFVHDIVAPSFYYVTQSDDIFPCLLRAPQTWIILAIAILLWWFWKKRGNTALACESRIPTQHSQSSTAGIDTPLLSAPHPQDRPTLSPLPDNFPQDAGEPGEQPISGSPAPPASSSGSPTWDTPAAPTPSSGNGSPALLGKGAGSSPSDVPSADNGAPIGEPPASPTPATGDGSPAPPSQAASCSPSAAPPTCSAPFGQPLKRPAPISGTRLPKQRGKATPYLPPPAPPGCNDAPEHATSTVSTPPSAYDGVLIHSVTPPSSPPLSESTSSAPRPPGKPSAPTSQPSGFDGASLGKITPSKAIVKHLLSPVQDESTAHCLSSICGEVYAEENEPSSSLAEEPLLLDTTIVGTTIVIEPDFIDEMDTGDSATADQVTAGADQWSEDGVADEPQYLSSSIPDAADESSLDSFVMDLYDGEVAETDQTLQFTSDRFYDPADADMLDPGVEFNGAAPETVDDIRGDYADCGDLAEPDHGVDGMDVIPGPNQTSDTLSLPDHDMDDPAAGGQTTGNDALPSERQSVAAASWDSSSAQSLEDSGYYSRSEENSDEQNQHSEAQAYDPYEDPYRNAASPPYYTYSTGTLSPYNSIIPSFDVSDELYQDNVCSEGQRSRSEDEGDDNEKQPYDPSKEMYTSNASPSHYRYPPSVQTPYNPVVPARQVITNVSNVPSTDFMDTLSKHAAAYQQIHGLGGVGSSLSPIKKAIPKRERSPDPDHESEPDESRDGRADAGHSITKRGRLDPPQSSDTATTIARFARSPMYPDDTFHPLKTLSCAPACRLVRRWCTRSIDAVEELERFCYKGKIVDHEDLEDHISVPEHLKEFEHMPHRIKQIREYVTNGSSKKDAWDTTDTAKIPLVQAKKMMEAWNELRDMLEALPDLLCDISDCFDDIVDELELLRSSWKDRKKNE
ncbi:hypothetical protein LTR37_005820 [Vermiconidia calcicola]|uniref:Uncharacterized protein n=1 Tax=Vermiconidia calcicola TaxID=1690605 RepID=A0ACC3NL28_9PEZI|nr:hypothetical protein LTR37_005820 [Vermiconidia calcicola]